MKIKISFEVELDVPSVLDDDYYELTVPKREFNKIVKNVVHDVIYSVVKDGVLQNDFEGKVQQRLLEDGYIKR